MPGTRLSVADFATPIQVLYTHHVTGSSQEEEVISYCGLRRLGPVPLGLCPPPTAPLATPRVSLTQNKRWLQKSMPTCCSIFFLKEKKCILLFCVNSTLLTQSKGSVSFGAHQPPPALTGLSGGRRSHQLIPKAEAPEILGPGWELIPQVPLCAPGLEMS